MRVVQICTNVMSGSVGSIVRNLYKEIESNGDECLICYGRGKEPMGYNAIKFNTQFDVFSHVILARLFDSDGIHSKNATKRLVKHLKDFNPDIIHIHCLHGYYINFPLLFEYFKQTNVRVVWTMHDCWAFTGHCCNFEYIGCDKWRSGCNHCNQKKRYPKSLFLDRSMQNYKMKKEIFTSLNNMVIVTPSQWLCNLIEDSFLKSTTRCIIPNGIDTNVFKRNNEFAISKNKTILAVASIWENSKGYKDLVELSNILPKDMTLKIVGLNKKQTKQFSQNTIVIERTNDIEELVEIYNSATVFFNPTYEDNYPTVNLEAIACHTPIVTYETGGSHEVLKNGEYGTHIKNKDYKFLIDYTREISSNMILFDFTNLDSISKKKMEKKYLNVYKVREI